MCATVAADRRLKGPFFFFFLPLIELFLQLSLEFVYPMLQLLPPLLRGQVAVVFQRRRLVAKAGNAHRCLSSRLPPGTSPEVNATDGSDSSSAEPLILTDDDLFPVELTLSRKVKKNKKNNKEPGSARGHESLSLRWVC